MSYSINETHDPNLRSWVESANDPNTDFPIQNLPVGLFNRNDNGSKLRIGMAIGDQILDLFECCMAGILNKYDISYYYSGNLNLLMRVDRIVVVALRRQGVELLGEGNTTIQNDQQAHPNESR